MRPDEDPTCIVTWLVVLHYIFVMVLPINSLFSRKTKKKNFGGGERGSDKPCHSTVPKIVCLYCIYSRYIIHKGFLSGKLSAKNKTANDQSLPPTASRLFERL